MGLCGSVSYRFAGLKYAEGGPDLVRQIVKGAASAVAEKGAFSTLIVGGTMGDSPQGDWAQAADTARMAVVHIIPCTPDAAQDLAGILFDDSRDASAAASPRVRPEGASWYVVLAGSSYSERNVVLASLAQQYAIAGGGPGTLLELLTLRSLGCGILPLVRTGGLVEGLEFQGQSIAGTVDALVGRPPVFDPGSAQLASSWAIVLGKPAPKCSSGDLPSSDAYVTAVREVFGHVAATSASNGAPDTIRSNGGRDTSPVVFAGCEPSVATSDAFGDGKEFLERSGVRESCCWEQ